jgi:ABC-type antimicrobial peptide transport system permease subunit
VDPLRLAAGDDVVAQALAWAAPLLPAGPVLVLGLIAGFAPAWSASKLLPVDAIRQGA